MQDVKPSTERENTAEPFAHILPHPLWRYSLAGALVGLVIFIATSLLQRFVIGPLTCQADNFSICTNAGAVAFNIATVCGGIIGTILLVKLTAYRPLLIAIAVAVSVWGLQVLIGTMVWYEAVSWIVALYAVSYSLFCWLARLRSLPLSLMLMLVIICGARVALQL